MRIFSYGNGPDYGRFRMIRKLENLAAGTKVLLPNCVNADAEIVRRVGCNLYELKSAKFGVFTTRRTQFTVKKLNGK